MRDEIMEFVDKVLSDVLARYAYLFGERVPVDELVPEGDSFLEVRVDFINQGKGILGLIFPEEMAYEVAANVLGTDPDTPLAHERAEDALKELLNVLCGQMRTTLLTDDAKFDESLPTCTRVGIDRWDEVADSPIAIGFMVEDRPILLMMSTGGEET